MEQSLPGMIAFIVIMGTAALVQAPQMPSRAAGMPCAEVAAIQVPDVKITEAVAVPAATADAVRVAHCRVTGVIGTEIRFRALLPDAWNGKFMMGGGGGYVGKIDNQVQAIVNAGFATVGTDTGHQAGVTDASWALNNPKRVVNFGHMAVHRTADVTKSIIRAYYGASASRNYFSGCSNGGRQALMEAQRYPGDFDGIVAGAPALDFVGIAAQFIKDIQAAFPDTPSTPVLTPDVLKSVGAQIVEKCDALDGVTDGLIEDPRKCAVDVAALTGVTDAQRAVLKRIYAETTAKDGRIYPAQPPGGEGEDEGWATWITGAEQPPTPQGPSLRYAFGTQFFKFFVYNDPAWSYKGYDLANARRDAKTAAEQLNSNNPNLDAFKSKGKKLLLWHGWSDPALTALASVEYYEQVEKRDEKVRDYFRMFMMPGVLHCTGGPGPDNVDWPTAITDWVENGKAPDRIVARKLGADGAVSRSRPLCPYPQHAVYSGTGSTDDEKSFVCK